jgi:PAS domain S-box-containing protein
MIGVLKRISLGAWVVGVGVLILCLVWVIALGAIHHDRGVEIARAGRHAASLASVLERHISSTLGQLDSSLNSLRRSWESGMDSSEMVVLLKHHVSSQSDLYNLIAVIDASGHVSVTNLDDFAPTFSGDRPSFLYHQQTKDQSTRMGGPLLGRVTGKWGLPVSVRINDNHGEFAGVLLASVNPYYFSSLFRELNLGRDSLIYLAGRDGAVYSGMRDGGELGLDVVIDPKLSEAVFAQGDFTLISSKSLLDGVERIQCRVLVPGRDLFVSVGLSLSEALSQWRTRTSIILVLLTLLSVTYFALLIRLWQAIASREKATLELERFFTSTLDLLCIADVHGRFVRTNAQWENTLGYSVQELEGRSFLDFVHPEDLPATLAVLSDLKAQNSVQSFVNRYRSKDCEYKHIEWRSSPQGELIYSAARDITDRKAVETVLRQSNEKLSLFIKHSPIFAFIKSVSPNESRVLFASDNFEDMIGIKSSDMIGKTMFELFPEDLARTMTVDDWSVVSDGKILKVDEELHGRHYTSIKFPIPQEDGILLAGYTIDVTERIHNDKALCMVRDAAEAANRAKSEFLANMSHEIRTPLNGMIATLELLKTTNQDLEQMGLTETAISSCNRLARLLSDILDLSRIEAGKLCIQVAPMSLRDVLGQTNELFKPIAREKGIELHFQIDQAIPDKILGDEVRLQQVFTNMVGNAIKFTHDGQVVVDAYLLPVRKDAQFLILFSFADTGIGIADNHLSDLFKVFSQVSEGYTRSHQGAGLGLSICKRLIDLMGGSVTVLSEPGAGTSFWFSLPFGLPEPVPSTTLEPVNASVTLPNVTGLSILLAEDDQVSAFATVRLLEKHGCRVFHVMDGVQALEALRSGKHFDVVLMDVQMPVMDGVTATRAIRANSAGEYARYLPIIAMTAYAMDGDKAIFLEAGMNDTLHKPVSMNVLRDVIFKNCQKTAQETLSSPDDFVSDTGVS